MVFPRRARLAVIFGTIAACDGGNAPLDASRPDITIAVDRGLLTVPDSVSPGWARVRVDERNGSHIVVVFRIPAAASDADVATFVAALDTAPATPFPGVAMGGPEIGSTGEVIMHFTPGRYVAGCLARGDGAHRHASSGESKVFVVANTPVDSAHRAPPHTSLELRMTEFAYAGPDKWPAGPQVVRIENTGSQDHQLRLERLSAGSTVADWLKSEGSDKHGTPVVGLARLGPGEVAYLPVDLKPGTHIAYCLITDPAKGRAHIELGMMRTIQVE